MQRRVMAARVLVPAAVIFGAVEIVRRAAEFGWQTMPAPVPILGALLLVTAVMVYTPGALFAWAPAVVTVAATVVVGLSSGFMIWPAALALVGTLFVAGLPPAKSMRGPGFEPENR